MANPEIKLKVMEAVQDDVNKGIVKTDSTFMKQIGVNPGDIVEIRRGQVFVSDKILDEPYVINGDRSNMAPLLISPDNFFVLGDSRKASNDSRDWGPVPAENIIGRAWLGYWPLNRFQVLGTAGGS